MLSAASPDSKRQRGSATSARRHGWSASEARSARDPAELRARPARATPAAPTDSRASRDRERSSPTTTPSNAASVSRAGPSGRCGRCGKLRFVERLARVRPHARSRRPAAGGHPASSRRNCAKSSGLLRLERREARDDVVGQNVLYGQVALARDPVAQFHQLVQNRRARGGSCASPRECAGTPGARRCDSARCRRARRTPRAPIRNGPCSSRRARRTS